MGRMAAAFRLFFQVLFDASVYEKLKPLLTNTPAAAPPPPPPPAPTPPPTPAPTQNSAITLLAALQREARLIDFLKEDLTPYTNEQIGAAVRDVQRDAGKVLERVAGIRPVLAGEEGASVSLPANADPARFRLTGQVTTARPSSGILQHHGWEATRCELPTFTGSAAAALIIAPAEVEIA